MMKSYVRGYQAPEFEVLEISAEQGFATSGGVVNPGDWSQDGEQDWF